MAIKDADTTGEPGWWLLRLGRALRERNKLLTQWWRYYIGDTVLPQGPAKANRAYEDFQRKARTNLCGGAVDASVFRLEVIGVADSDGEPDDEAWRWWQLNRFDAAQKRVYRLALAQSVAYVIVGPHPEDPTRPLMTVEHPREVMVIGDTATGGRRVAIKAWHDELDGYGHATVYLPERICKYQTVDRRAHRNQLAWGQRSWDLVEEFPNPYERVPVVPFECRPEVGEDPRPEFFHGFDVQDRLNLGTLNRLTAERYSAFRQKYVTGHRFPRREVVSTDPETGLETVRYEPDPTAQPFTPDPASLWASEGENTHFGEFSATDISGYLRSHEADIKDFLFLTHTPAYLHSTDLVNVSGETVQALDAMHIAKVKEHIANFSDALEEVLELAALVAGSELDRIESEVRWRDPRQLQPQALADAATKKSAIGYPLEILAEDLGESPQRVRRITAAKAAELLTAALAAPPPPPLQQPQTQPPQQGQQQLQPQQQG